MSKPVVGDYVLATKQNDGDPRDPFAIGFVEEITPSGEYRIDICSTCFRRAEKITRDEGQKLIAIIEQISDKPGPSVWEHLVSIRAEEGERGNAMDKDIKVVNILKALLEGLPVKLFGRECELGRDGSICVPCQKGDEKVWLALDISFKDFVQECWKLSDEEINKIIRNRTLNKLRINNGY